MISDTAKMRIGIKRAIKALCPTQTVSVGAYKHLRDDIIEPHKEMNCSVLIHRRHSNGIWNMSTTPPSYNDATPEEMAERAAVEAWILEQGHTILNQVDIKVCACYHLKLKDSEDNITLAQAKVMIRQLMAEVAMLRSK